MRVCLLSLFGNRAHPGVYQSGSLASNSINLYFWPTQTHHSIRNMNNSKSLMEAVEDAARNCSLRLEHVEALNLSHDFSQLMRLYNMCEHTWDPDKTWDVYYWEELAPPLIVYLLTLLCGFVGNLLIIVAILGYRRMKSPTNIFLASLAFADLLLCMICLPVKLAELFAFSWTFGLFLCKFVNYMQNVSAVASVLNLTVMSVERCYAIVYPMKAKSVCTVSKAKKVVFIVWIASFILATPTLIVQEHLEVGLVQKVFLCVRGGIDNGDGSMANSTIPTWAWPTHEIYFSLIILVIPGGFMIAAYGAIAKKICQCMKERSFLVGSRPEPMNSAELASSAKKARANGKSGWSLSLIGRKKGPEQQRKAKSFNGKPLESGKKDEENHSPLNHTPCCSCCKTCDVHQLKLTKLSSNSSHNHHPDRISDRVNPWIPITQGYIVQKHSLKKFRRVIRMLVVIIVVFIFCWTPYLAFSLLQAFGVVDLQVHGFTKHAKTTFTLMAYLNSALNPVIYGFMSKSFRESFHKVMCTCFGSDGKSSARQITGYNSQIQSELVNRDEKIQPPQLCCKHKQENNLTNNHGLRINRSRGNASSARTNFTEVIDHPKSQNQVTINASI